MTPQWNVSNSSSSSKSEMGTPIWLRLSWKPCQILISCWVPQWAHTRVFCCAPTEWHTPPSCCPDGLHQGRSCDTLDRLDAQPFSHSLDREWEISLMWHSLGCGVLWWVIVYIVKWLAFRPMLASMSHLTQILRIDSSWQSRPTWVNWGRIQ